MSKLTYEQALADHTYLWDINPAYDMTGGYVDQEDLQRLLHSPTKATARDCLHSQIVYWFRRGCGDERQYVSDWQTLIPEHPKLVEIAQRHGCWYGSDDADE